MKECARNRAIKLLLPSVLLISPCYANAGVPMLFLLWPSFIVALIPVIWIEWSYMKSVIHDVPQKKLLYSVSVSNVFSTFIGVPLAWGIMLGLELLIPGGMNAHHSWGPFLCYLYGLTVQAAWLIPYEEHLWWLIPAAFVVLMLPCFLLSYWSELLVARAYLKLLNIDQRVMKNAVLYANIRSYMFLLLFPFGFFIFGLFRHH